MKILHTVQHLFQALFSRISICHKIPDNYNSTHYVFKIYTGKVTNGALLLEYIALDIFVMFPIFQWSFENELNDIKIWISIKMEKNQKKRHVNIKNSWSSFEDAKELDPFEQ